MMSQCSAHAQLKSVYGAARVMRHRTPGPPICMSKVRGPGVEARLLSVVENRSRSPSDAALEQ